jgi:hypothetical protein|tara:strand:- start:83 stop:313 length:231 start_codon:yes stop_codon:yes gene_type:complete
MEHQDLFLEQDILLEVVEEIQRVIQQLVKDKVELVAVVPAVYLDQVLQMVEQILVVEVEELMPLLQEITLELVVLV